MHESPYGKIISDWKRKGNTVTYTITVPPNSDAVVSFPVADGKKVYRNGKVIAPKITLGAGIYQFEIA
ncbi:Bacterial alpha-L-rhamnosidase [compost metagenome]